MATPYKTVLTHDLLNPVHQEVVSLNGHIVRLLQRIEQAKRALCEILQRGYTHWIITFSGGKDSSTTAIIALEAALKLSKRVQRIDIIYSDTGIEIPAIQIYALEFLDYLKQGRRFRNLPLHCHVVRPRVEERFWVCLLGKGYPPPHQRFRWCTRRLKIEPVEEALRDFIQPGKTVILTGVRFGESRTRDHGLHASCKRGGECGQGVWFTYSSRLQVGYMAPIINWQECDVWDFLNLYAPALGYPTAQLERHVYNGRETRFGCWMCTVVRQDKTMEKLITLPKWEHLRPLMEFRNRVKGLTQLKDSRMLRPDGKPGKLSLGTRKKLLEELLSLQTSLNIPLISEEEVVLIHKLWKDPNYRGY
jgi:DNA sulfur modification protein DndC